MNVVILSLLCQIRDIPLVQNASFLTDPHNQIILYMPGYGCKGLFLYLKACARYNKFSGTELYAGALYL